MGSVLLGQKVSDLLPDEQRGLVDGGNVLALTLNIVLASCVRRSGFESSDRPFDLAIFGSHDHEAREIATTLAPNALRMPIPQLSLTRGDTDHFLVEEAAGTVVWIADAHGAKNVLVVIKSQPFLHAIHTVLISEQGRKRISGSIEILENTDELVMQ